jgi:Domain of unknown function (DUF3846)
MHPEPETRILTKASERPTLEEAQAFVGGYVEKVPNLVPTTDQVFANEDGIRLSLPVNRHASILIGYELRGNVLILFGKARWD